VRPLLTLALLFVAAPLRAQDNYEIQVYGSDTVAKGFTMVELHSNFTAKGFSESRDGVQPDSHAPGRCRRVPARFVSPSFLRGRWRNSSSEPVKMRTSVAM
jgi:hypothetical protein